MKFRLNGKDYLLDWRHVDGTSYDDVGRPRFPEVEQLVRESGKVKHTKAWSYGFVTTCDLYEVDPSAEYGKRLVTRGYGIAREDDMFVKAKDVVAETSFPGGNTTVITIVHGTESKLPTSVLRSKGRKLSLTDALKRAGFTPGERQQVWVLYLRNHPTPKTELQKLREQVKELKERLNNAATAGL